MTEVLVRDRNDERGEGGQPRSLRKDLGSQLLAEFIKAGEAVEEALDQVGPADWDKLCYRGSGAEPIKNILDQFITEFAVHRWDVTVPFDPNVNLSQDCLAVMVERYPHRPRWWDIALPTNHSALPARIRFEIIRCFRARHRFRSADPGRKIHGGGRGFTPRCHLPMRC